MQSGSRIAFSFIMQVIKPFRLHIFGIILSAFVWSFMHIAQPYLMKLIVDKVHNTEENIFATIGFLMFLYLALEFIFMLVIRFYDWVSLLMRPNLKKHIGLVLMNRMMSQSYSFYQHQFAGNLTNKITEVIVGIPDIVKLITNRLIAYFLLFMFSFGVLATIHLKFAIALGVWLCCYFSVAFILVFRYQYLAYSVAEARATVTGYVVDILTNMPSVRLFCGKKYEHEHLNRTMSNAVSVEQRRDWFFFAIHAFQHISFLLFLLLCFWWLLNGLTQKTITAGAFVLVLTLNLRIIENFWNIARDMLEFWEKMGNVVQGLQVIQLPIEVKDKPDAKELKVARGHIEFNHVMFHYKGAELLFENKSVTIKSGQKVGLVGRSGSGKSTFISLILRLFDVTSGSITIDGQDIRDVTQKSLHQSIAMIPQDPTLFHRSIIDNIRYGKMDATNQEIITAAKRAFAHEFIIEQSQGYDTLVGERGARLSGGQRQRIVIARAILKNAPILILDEATSQLDTVTERHIQDSLRELMQDKTTIVIAHRLSTLLQMDRILVFDEGTIVGDGTHEELIAAEGLYKTLWEAQVGGLLIDSPEEES